MNQIKIKILFSLFILSSFSVYAQMNDKEKFREALYLIDENRFAAAEPLLEELYANDKENANVNYCLGLSIFKTFTQKDKERALPFLKFASQNVKGNYSYLDPKEKKAPVDAWYYLGKAQHNDYQFLEAIESFKKFETLVTDKYPLYNEIEKSINMANYAQKSVLNPVNIKTTNLGAKLNGFYPDFSPVVRIDESAVYYTSRRLRKDSSNYNIYDPLDGMMFEDIYVSQKDEEGTWGEPYPLNINTDGHEATVNLSIDGRTLYVYKDINGNGQLFESKLENDSLGFETWSEPELLGSDINSKAYETHVTITPDGKKLYFISDREGGFGGKDIYFCNRLPMGTWALSQNAGPILNSDHNEDGVFMHPDGKTMYFSSDGHESMGGYDIVFSTMTDSGWTKPANMGYPINSVDDDVFFVTTPDGKRAYFSSFKEEGYGEKDVYILELIDAEETALTLYKGEFTFVDRTVPPSGAEVTITSNTDGELVGVYSPRERDGQFSAILIPNQSYHFEYSADGYETYEEDIYVSSAGNYQEIYKEIKLRPVRVGEGLTKMTPAPLAMANIKGGLIKNGVPMPGLRIELLDENETLLKKTTSDDTGDFQMTELDPSKVYLIRVFSPTGNPLRGYDVEVKNDQGEELPFEELDDTTYIFIPSIQPYEFYGIGRVKTLAGSIKKDGKPIQGLQVRLENDEQDMIDSKETDQYGQFNFQKLNLDEEYRIVFEGDFPDDVDIIITNDLGQKMRFIREQTGIYKYVPLNVPMPKALLTDVGGAVTSQGTPIVNLHVLLLNADQSLINSAATDDVGKFNFEDLDLTKRYFIKFEGDFPPDLRLVMSNDNFDLLLFKKIEEGLYQYDPIFVRLENANSEILGKEVADNIGELNQKKLALDQYYQIIFEGNFPELDIITLSNDKDEEFSFIQVRPGVYEYVPPLTQMPKATLADIQGTVTSNTAPVVSLQVLLLRADQSLINSAATDNVGQFNFEALDLTKQYFIKFEGDFPPDLKLVVSNADFDLLLFIKIEEGLYQYNPVFVRLENSRSEVLGKEVADNVGELNLKKLNLDQSYQVIFEGNFPEMDIITLTNDRGEEFDFINVRPGVYEYVPRLTPMPKALLTDIGGAVTSKGTPVTNLQVLLLKADQSLINSAATDNVGQFNFEALDLTNRYFIKFEGDFPPDLKLVVSNDNFDLLLFRKIQDGLYQYDPIFVRLENSKSEVLGKEVVDNVGELNQKKLKLDQYYQVIFEGNFPEMEVIALTNDKGEEFDFKFVRPGVYEYVPRGGLTLNSYTIDVKDELDFKETYPRPEELKDVVAYFQKYFTYNMKDISETNKEFVSFIKDIGELVKVRGDAKIIITSSASKVPTRTWKTNSILTRKRAYDTKTLLERVFAAQGINAEQYNFVDINTLITGPEYKGDYLTNKTAYEKYQYVRIFIK